MSHLDEIYDLWLFHLRDTEFHPLRGRRADRQAHRRSSPKLGLARLLGPLDGFLFGRPGRSYYRLSKGPLNPGTEMPQWACHRVRRQVLPHLWSTDRRIANLVAPSSVALAGHAVKNGARAQTAAGAWLLGT